MASITMCFPVSFPVEILWILFHRLCIKLFGKFQIKISETGTIS